MNSYIKTNWVNGGEPAITAENLNNIENGIEAATEGVTAVEQGKADISHTHPVDSAFSLTSTNPIQNVVVTRKINEIIADANNNFSNVNTQLAGKADKATTYTKSKVDELLGNKVDSSVYNQKIGEIEDEVDSMQDNVDSIDIQLSAKANKETTLAGYGITDAYTKSKVEERIDESFELKTLFPNNSGSSDGYLINEVISPGSSGYRDEYCCLFGGATHATGLDALTPENFGESYHIEIFLDNVNIRGIIFQELRTGESGGINYPSAWNVSLSQDEYTSLSGTKIEHDYTMGATTTSIFRMRLRCNGNNLQQVRVKITKNRGLEKTSNKVVTVSEESTDTEYPSAKCLYNALQGCMQYESISSSVSTSGLDNLTESNTIYDFLYNDIHEKVILLFIDSGERAESEGQELFLNCTQIMFTQSGKILKRQSDDEGAWGVVINVVPDVSLKVDKYQYLQDLEKIDNSINSKADESKLTAVQASFNIALGFKEANANKVSIIDPDNADDTQYPSARAVVNYINTILGKGASESD